MKDATTMMRAVEKRKMKLGITRPMTLKQEGSEMSRAQRKKLNRPQFAVQDEEVDNHQF